MTAPGPGPHLRPQAVNVLRIVFATIGALALVLGYLGLATLLSGGTNYPNDPMDLFYYDVQLFVLGSSPLEQGTKAIPPALQVARFAAPAVTIYAFVEGGRLLLATELRRLRARHAGGHAVVCGDSAVAHVLAARLHAEGSKVVVVRGGSTPGLGPAGRRLLWVAGDATDPEVLRGAGVSRADVLYACTPDSADNAAIAQAAGLVTRRPRRPLAAYAQITDPELCLALQARRLGQPEQSGLRLDFFNTEDLAARVLFAEEPLRPRGDVPPGLLIAGASAFGRAVLVAAARQWRMDAGAGRLRVDLIDEGGGWVVGELTGRYPFLAEVCRLRSHETDLISLLDPDGDGRAGDGYRPDRIVMCYDDEEYSLRTALTAQALWYGPPRSVVVRLDRLAGLAQAFHGSRGDQLFDQVSGKLRLYRATEAACDPRLIGEDLTERLARVIHEHYLVRQLRAPGAGAAPAAVPWSRLPEQFKRANLAEAQGIGSKLRQIDCVLAPRTGADAAAKLSDAEIERLATAEHDRWAAELTRRGWRCGPRDDDARRHPALCPWEELPEHEREKNRESVRELPLILADAGFQIIRLR